MKKVKLLQEQARILKKTIPKRFKKQPLPKSMKDEEFKNDIFTILRPDVEYDNDLAYKHINEKIISKI
jgi:hypothetical protein